MAEANKKYVFVGKTLFFPKDKILVVGDLHLGYDEALRQGGLEIPIGQFKETEKELTNTLENIKAKFGKIEQIIFLGDIKHHFNYLASEREEIKKLLSFLKKRGFEENNIIFIRGNHEKNEKNEKFIDFYIVKDMAFTHGDKEFLEVYDKNINLVVMGHLHPTVTLEDRMKIKNEKYKCFLVGRYKKKDFVVLPSFLSTTEGVSLSEYFDEKGYDFSIIPNSELENFEVFVVQDIEDSGDALDFGKLKNI